MSCHPVSSAAAVCRRHADRDRYDERGDTLLEILMTLIVLGIAVVALIVTFETGISASVDHKNLAANDVVLRQVEEQAFYQIQQRSSPKALYTSCATSAVGGPYSPPNIVYNNLPANYTVTLNPILYWDTTVSPAQFDSTCAVDSPQLISLTLTAPNGSIATTTFVVDDLGAGTSGNLGITSLTPNSAVQGTSNLALALVGTGFTSDAEVSFSGPSAITVNSVTFVTSTLLDLNVTVPATATASSAYTVTVTDPSLGTSITSPPIFTVLSLGVTNGMHISGMSATDFFLPIWPIVEITVVDASGRPLRHATVTGSWSSTPSGFNITTSSCTTDGSGNCWILYDLFGFPSTGGTATYTVSGVSATGQIYAPTKDVPSPPSIPVTWP